MLLQGLSWGFPRHFVITDCWWVGYSMCAVIVAVLINSGSDNCLPLVLFPRNHKQPNILTTKLGMSRTGNQMLACFNRLRV